MPTLRRDDGLQFVISSYREVFPLEGASALKRKIRLYATRHGNYLRVFKANENVEVVFSPEPGFLLGETVWIYLNKPDNLIYCEALPERRQAIFVVVRGGVVFIDARASYTEMMDEFAFLSTTNEKFDIYTFGDVPLGETSEEGKFVFEKNMVNSFNSLQEPVLPKLPVYEATQLQPLELALTSPLIGKSKLVPIILICLGIIGIIAVWETVDKIFTSPTIKVQLGAIQKPIDPYLEYNQSLMTPGPKSQLTEFVSLLNMVDSLPGWKAEQISYANKNFSVNIVSNGGTIATVRGWAKINNIQVELQAGKISLTVNTTLSNREKPSSIYPLQELLAFIIDHFNLMLGGQNVVISDISNKGSFKQATVTINFNNILPGMLVLMGEELNMLPVNVENINATLQNHSSSGNIMLQVLGD